MFVYKCKWDFTPSYNEGPIRKVHPIRLAYSIWPAQKVFAKNYLLYGLTRCYSLCGLALSHIGGFEHMREMYMQSAANYTYFNEAFYGNNTCGMPRDDAFHIFRGLDSDYPWTGLVGGLTILATNSWCTDQVLNLSFLFPPASAIEGMESVPPVCVSVS